MTHPRNPKHEPPRRAILEPPSAESLGLDDLLPDEGEDTGISLEELGQTYAALDDTAAAITFGSWTGRITS